MMRHVVLIVLSALLLAACSGEPGPHFPGVFVVGFDGMEPTIVEELMAKGELPNFARLAKHGTYSRLGTSNPSESPVAWANFSTGKDPGGHSVFDFIHHEILEEGGVGLYFSTAKSTEPSDWWSLPGPYRIPLSGGETSLLVEGKFFWEYLTERDIPVSIIRIPSNYPPRDVGARTFPGLGTPDLLGAYGVFSYYTDNPPPNVEEFGDSVNFFRVTVAGGAVKTKLKGPVNDYVDPPDPIPYGWRRPVAEVDLTVYPDAERGVARIDVGEESRILVVGEWSDWVPVSFEMVPWLVSASGMVRLYLQELTPDFKLYVSPVNADPLNPDIPLSTPPEACEELAHAIGRYYTKGMSEETSANRFGVFSTKEFLAQADLVLEERERMLDFELERFKGLGGFTFFYFSTTDLCAHMLYQYMDPKHPMYDAEQAAKYRGEVARIYRKMDAIFGRILDTVPEDTLVIALSDHGFRPYRRQLSINTWLYENGFLRIRDPSRQGESVGYGNVDWGGTRAYGVGFTGIAINLYGRENPGFVNEGREEEEVKRQIIRGLEALVDPKTGERVVTKVYRREDIYHGPYVERAPDLIVGFNEGYGNQDASVKGAVPRALLKDTDDAWSGHHLMDPRFLPGILLANRKFRLQNPKLYDLPVSILAEFGIEAVGMRGQRIWGED